MKKLYAIIPFLVVLLAGCSKHESYQYMATHPKLLEQTLRQCAAMPIMQSAANATCVTAQNARQEVAAYLHEISTNTQGFGQKIIKVQIQLADLKKADKAAPSDKLKNKITAQEALLARMLAICQYIGE